MNTAVVHQRAWDGRAAANFMAGGAGSGLVVATACGATLAGSARWPFVLGAAIVLIGLAAVWAEIGRPWRALNVFLHARTSWMTREALLAPLLLGLALAAALLPAIAAAAAPLAALAALAFVYCQARMLRAARGIPTWREPAIVPLIVATALVEGGALWLIASSAARWARWRGWSLPCCWWRASGCGTSTRACCVQRPRTRWCWPKSPRSRAWTCATAA